MKQLTTDKRARWRNIMRFVWGISVGVGFAQLCFGQVPTGNLTLWVDANSLSPYLSDGDNVAVWSNQSIFVTQDLTQSSVASQPIYKANVVNGNAAVRFDGTADFLTSAAISTFITSNQYTVYTVFNARVINTDNNSSVWANDPLIEDASGYFGQLLKGTNAIAYNWDTGPDFVPTSITTNQWHMLGSRHLGGNLFIHKESEPDQFVASGPTQVLTFGLRVGSRGGSLAYFDGDISEILIYNTALSPADRSTVEEYLYAKYSIPEPSAVALLMTAAFLLLRRRCSQ